MEKGLKTLHNGAAKRLVGSALTPNFLFFYHYGSCIGYTFFTDTLFCFEYDVLQVLKTFSNMTL